MSKQVLQQSQGHSASHQSTGESVPQCMPTDIHEMRFVRRLYEGYTAGVIGEYQVLWRFAKYKGATTRQAQEYALSGCIEFDGAALQALWTRYLH